MKKLKQQKTNNLVNYQQFLKNTYLKKKTNKLKNILFENHILYIKIHVTPFYKNIRVKTHCTNT